MLRLRIISALVLLPMLFFSVMMMPPVLFALLTSFVMLLGAWEWARLSGLTTTLYRAAYCGFFYFCLLLSLYLPYNITLLIFGIWWGFIALWEFRYPKDRYWSNPWFVGFLGTQILIPFWLTLISYVNSSTTFTLDRYILLYVFILVILADTGAYFAGHRFGKNKLVPRLSPGKTWEGAFGGLVIALAFAVLVALLLKLPALSWFKWITLSAATVVVSIIGDLGISLFKREQSLKDSGHLIPGHGGLLDRIDSLLAALPFFTFGLYVLQVSVYL